IDPTPLRKKIGDITDMLAREDADTTTLLAQSGGRKGRKVQAPIGQHTASLADRPAGDLADLIAELSEQMHAAAAALQFEIAARLRDEISERKKELRGMLEAEA
ncbi:UvrB/UvrC motif-containing protein, partial [Aeromicrobium sp.]